MVVTSPDGETEVVQDIPDIFQIGGIYVSFFVGENPFIRLVLDRWKGDEYIRVFCGQKIPTASF
jgi:hypothetical protein